MSSSSQVLSGSSVATDEGKRAAVDPDGVSMDENGGTLRSSPSNVSMKSSSSPRNYRIATVDGDESVMTETEVSNLVHKALRRARKSTSPRKSPKSASFDDTSSASVAPLEPVAKSPPRDPEFESTPEASFSPGDDFHDLLAPSHDSISLAPKSSQDDFVAASTNSQNTHLSASDAIIRRVEEEIANARKEAEAASARLSNVLTTGSRDTSSVNDWRATDKEWQDQDSAVITMKPSMDINDILNDHLADDEEFQVVAGNSFADDEHLAAYLRADAERVLDEEYAKRTTSEPQQQPAELPSHTVDERLNVTGNDEKIADLEQERKSTEDDLPDDERKYFEGQTNELSVEQRDVETRDTSSIDKAENDNSEGQQHSEKAIQSTATGEASLQNSSQAPTSESTAETNEDLVFQKNSTASGENTSSGEDFAAESYETAEEELLPLPLDSDKDTPVSAGQPSPKKESKDLPKGEIVEVSKLLTDKEPGSVTDSKSHPAIGSEIFLTAQTMDAVVSHVDNDDASEYTEETVSDEESEYTEITIHDTDTGLTSDKSVDKSKSDDAPPEKSNQERALVGIPEEEEPKNGPTSPPAVAEASSSPWESLPVEQLARKSVSSVDEYTEDDAKAVLENFLPMKRNDIVDKLESARNELEKPKNNLPPSLPTLEPKPVAVSKSGARRVTLSVITEPMENEHRRETSRSSKSDVTPRDSKSKDEKPKRIKVSFRAPYPPPPPMPQTRPAAEIIEEYREPVPEPSSIWLRPKTELKQLLLAVMGASLPRRSNACGALKVLSMKTKKNKLTLVKTDGFLSALVFALCDEIPIKDRDVALDARTRAVTTILNVVEPKENRTIVFSYPGLPEALVKVIQEDRAEARVQACQAVAMLAKTAACREQMVKVDGLIDVLAKVLQNTIDRNTSGQLEEEKKEESFDDDEGNHGSSSYSDDDGSTDGSDDDESHTDGETSDDSSAPPKDGAPARLQSIRKKKHDQLSEFANQARVSACAALSHLSKHCSISNQLCANQCFIECLVAVSCEFENPIHTKCVEMITNLTRFPANNEVMAQQPALLEALVKCGKSKTLADRVWALRAFQNMSADPPSKVPLASSTILTLLSVCAVRRDYEERIPAVAALFNISTEPGAVVPLTNTRNVVATLVHLAHNSESSPEIRHMACDALATIGLWLQTLAGTGHYPEGVKKVPLPSHATTGWQIWN